MRLALATVVVAVVALSSQGAQAQTVDCDDLPNSVYLQIGDTQENLIKRIGRHLRDSTVKPLTLIYLKGSSCVNVDAFESGALLRANPLYVPSADEDPAWEPTQAAPSCVINPAGVPLDIGNSATFISSCTSDPPPADVVRVSGAIQAYAFVVPEASNETVITAEEAYFVYGFGAAGQVAPWTVDSLILQRPTTASTQLTLMANIGVPVDRAKGVEFQRSGQLLTALTSSVAPQATIGLLGVEVADAQRNVMNILAFRAFDQRLAYYPDKTSTSFDKKNVRDGHYVPWSPAEWMYRVDTEGQPENPDARYVVDLLVGAVPSPAPDFDPVADVIAVGAVPRCAMKVTRPFEGAQLSPFAPDEPCGCFFEAVVDEPAAYCVACDQDTPCASGVCRHGFCEER